MPPACLIVQAHSFSLCACTVFVCKYAVIVSVVTYLYTVDMWLLCIDNCWCKYMTTYCHIYDVSALPSGAWSVLALLPVYPQFLYLLNFCKKTEWWGVGMVSVWSEVQICISPSWCHCHLLSLAPVNPDCFTRMVLLFWHRLTRVVLEKRPLNDCDTKTCRAGRTDVSPTDGGMRPCWT